MLKKCLLTLCVLLLGTLLKAQERITDFDVIARINSDASVSIEETITVVALHRQIRRGIYRDLPIVGNKKVADIRLSMDGSAHPFFTESRPNKLRINFGDNNYISQGEHTYKLHYTISNEVRLFFKHDEFYWNVTGSEWAFPIEKASIQVILPDGAIPDEARISSYVGKKGTKGTSAKRGELSSKRGLFFQTATIYPGEDFTVAVPWQKGLMHPPAGYYLHYWVLGVLLLGMVLLGFYYKWAWEKVGQDPTARVLVQYEPPENISPALATYIDHMGPEGTQALLPVIIVSLAMKGFLSIEQEKTFLSKSVFVQKKFPHPEVPLSEEERLVLNNLFREKGRVKLNDTKNKKLFLAIGEHLKIVMEEKSTDYFSRNTRYNIPTWLFLTVGALLLFRADTLKNFSMLLIGLYFAATLLAGRLMSRTVKCLTSFLILFIVLVFLAAHNNVILGNPVVLAGSVLLMLTALIGGLFHYWVKAYTIEGREVMDQIEGFKRYMEVGEAGRVAASDPTDELRIFCDYLPYAYAFGMASKWMKQFESKFSDEQLRGVMTARGFSGFASGNMISSINSSLSSVTAAVSSGSGGGGAAGGGGGGGGGGGR